MVGTGVLVDEPTRIRFANAPSRARRIVRTGDTIFSTVRTYLKATWFAEEITDTLICSTGFAVLTPREATSRKFVSYLAQSNPITHRVTAESVGTAYPAIPESRFSSFHIPLPPLPEQTAIVRYLDHADQRIRSYVTAKKRLVELLQEERQALINQAVTRGLDPNVPLKPSGVEWLGDVPAHWEVRRIRTLGKAIIGLTYSPQDIVGADEGRLVLRASNISGGRIVDADNVYVRCPVPDKLVLCEGDILICSRSGSRNLIGKNAYIDSNSAGVTFGVFMTILRGPHNGYLHQVFNSKLFEYHSGAFLTSTINQLTLGILNDMKIPFPPIEERKAILEHLKESTARIDAAAARARRQIQLLEEYRTRLIADAVTGKLDLRHASDPHPTTASTRATVVQPTPAAS